MVVAGPSNYVPRFINSLIIAFGSTVLAVALGTLAAYGFSRFRVPLKDDLLFFILSTRMMPPIAVAIPIYLMYRTTGLSDTRLGMILLYTSVNVSLAVWLLKGFIDEIPREYEEAAMIDGYTRFQAFVKVVLPQATTGIAATAIFCLIFAWNEYAFAVLLTSGNAQTSAAVHSDHHRRGRAGLARGRRRHDAVPGADRCVHGAVAQASAARHHLWSGSQMSLEANRRRRAAASRTCSAARSAGSHRDGDHCHRRRHADAAVFPDALFLVLRDHAVRYGDVHHRVEGQGVDAMAQIRVETLDKSFGDVSSRSRPPSFTVEDGQFLCLLGPSGCGKTTTLRMIAGLELPTSGTIRLDGEDVTMNRASARDIAFVFQLFALYPHMNVRRNIGFPLKCEGIGAAETRPAGRRRRAHPAHFPSA